MNMLMTSKCWSTVVHETHQWEKSIFKAKQGVLEEIATAVRKEGMNFALATGCEYGLDYGTDYLN